MSLQAVREPGAASRWMGGLACIFGCLAALASVDAVRFADPDLFVNLYSGREILSRGWVPYVDTVTFTQAGQPWMDYEWVGRLLFYVLHARLGAGGLILLRLALTCGVLLVLLAQSRCYSSSPIPFLAAVTVFSLFAGPFFIFRTTLFTFLLIPSSILILDIARRGKPGAVWLIPPLMVLWVNVHAGFALGVGVLGAAAVESLVAASRQRLGPARSGPPGGLAPVTGAPALPLGHAAGALALTLLASGVNPFGFSNWTAIYRTLGGEFTTQLSEWMPLYQYPFLASLPIYLLLAGVAASLAVARRHVGLFDLLVLGPLGTAAFLRYRFIPLFTLAAVMLLPRILMEWRRARRKAKPSSAGMPAAPPGRGRTLATHSVLAALAAFATLWIWTREGRADLTLSMLDMWTPVGSVKFLQENRMGGRILNEYDWGGYIRYMLPDSPIYIDGRSDTVYPQAFIEEWMRFVAAADPGWASVPQRYGAQMILIRRGNPVVELLRRDRRWLYAYEDDSSALFVLDSPENADAVARLRSGLTVSPQVTEEDHLFR